MATDDAPPVIWVPADPINVNFSLHDVLSKVAEKAGNLTAPANADQTLKDLLQTYNTLAGQLRDVATQINNIDPTILGGTP